MKYKVTYVVYSNMEWQHWDKTKIIEASSKEEAKEIIENYSSGGYDFCVEKVEEIKE